MSFIPPEELSVRQNTNHIKKVFHKPDDQVDEGDLVYFVMEQLFYNHDGKKATLLKYLGVEEFSPGEILYSTRGRSFRNNFWVRYPGDDLDYEKDIKTGSFISEQSKPTNSE